MPKLIVEDMPADIYERLRQRAEAERRSLPEETVHLLDQALRAGPQPRLPDLVPSEEIPAPCDLPRSGNSKRVSVRSGGRRLPDSLE